MIVEAQVTIHGSKEAVWAAMTDIAKNAEIIRGIRKIEIVEKPATGLVGLRWKETRLLFGEPATVEKWITEAEEPVLYATRAEDGGFVFLTTHRITEVGGGVTLTAAHETLPQGLAARLRALPMVFFVGAIRKEITKDLNDLKAAVEGAPGAG